MPNRGHALRAVGGAGARTVFACAEYVYDLDVSQSSLRPLPTVLHVPAGPVGAGRVASIVDLLAGEVARTASGRGRPWDGCSTCC